MRQCAEFVADPVGELAEEFVARYRRGERPAVSEYVGRRPDLEERIRQLFPVVLLMEQAVAPEEPDVTGSAEAAVGETTVADSDRIGGYRLVREIGRGGMGVVYEAEQVALGRRVALKLLPRSAAPTGPGLARFRFEAKAAARLHHSNIVPVYEVGDEAAVCFYAMQYIDGQPLDRVLDELRLLRAEGAESPYLGASVVLTATGEGSAEGQRTTYWRSVAEIGLQVAEALDYAHREGILHRDIKPSNLLLDVEGRVWVTDFGLAKFAAGAASFEPAAAAPVPENGAGGNDLTRTGDLVGTLRYMAPERFRGQSDPRSDVYSLGLTLYEFLALQPAFAAADRLELLRQISHAEPPPLPKIAPTIPRDLVTIVAKAIEKDPGRRYASAAELAADLRRFLADQPIRARHVSAWERTCRWCRRNPAVASLTAAVLFLTLFTTTVGFGAVLWQKDVAVRNEQEANRKRDEMINLNARLYAAQEQLRQTLYAAQLQLAQNAFNTPGGLPRTLELLEQQRPRQGEADLRGFEWRYLFDRCNPERRILRGHAKSVEEVAYTQDGTRLASLAEDGMLTLWDVPSGREIWNSHDTGLVVQKFALSPDGRRLALAGNPTGAPPGPLTALLRILDLQRQARIRDITPAAPMRIFALQFSADGQRLVGGGGPQRGATNFYGWWTRIWDATTGKELLALNDRGGSCVALSPDGACLAAGENAGPVQLLDAQSGRERLTLANSKGAWKVVFSPAGDRLAALRPEGLALWETATGKQLWNLEEPARGFRDVAFSPDGKRVAAAAAAQESVILFAAASGVERQTLIGHLGAVNTVAFHPNGRQLASGASDWTIALWDVATPVAPAQLVRRGAALWGMAISPDGAQVAVTGGSVDRKKASVRGETTVWDLATGKETRTIAGEGYHCVAYSPEGSRLATDGPDGKITVWDAATGKPVFTVRGQYPNVQSLAFTPDGQRLIAATYMKVYPGPSQRGEIAVWNAASGEPLLKLAGEMDQSYPCMAISPDGVRLATIANANDPAKPRNTLVVWRLSSAAPILQAEIKDADRGCISSLVFSPDGSQLAAVHADKTVRLWDPTTGALRRGLKGHVNSVMGAAFSPDGRRLATASADRTVKLWDLATGQELLTLTGPSFFSSVAFSPDGNRLVAAGGDTVAIWNAFPHPLQSAVNARR